MKDITRIDASARLGPALPAGAEASHSRKLADEIVERLTSDSEIKLITARDLATNPMPIISNMTIQGFYTPADAMNEELVAATALSDSLIAEIEASDIIVISCLIYNFSVPSALKAWIDQIVRIGRTFAYEDGNFLGLVQGKTAYVAYAYGTGGYAEGEPLQSFDYMKPYLTMILNFIGIEEVHSFSVEGTTGDQAAVDAAHTRAHAEIQRHFESKEAV